MSNKFPKLALPPESMDWGREVEKRLGMQEKSISRASEAAFRAEGAQNGLVDLVAKEATTGNIAATVEPLAPAAVTATPTGTWGVDGSADSKVALSWDMVAADTRGEYCPISQYEVWGRSGTFAPVRVLASTTNTAVVEGLPVGATYLFSVRAQSAGSGTWGQFSPEVSVETVAPNVPLAAPTTPSASSALGAISVSWDGKLISGPAPAQLNHVYVGASATESGTYTPIGQPLMGAGTAAVTDVPVGQTRWFKLFAVDNAGKVSPGSAAVSATSEGVDVSGIEADLTALQGSITQLGTDLGATDAKAVAAQSAAAAAQTKASEADAAAASAAGIANSKAVVLYQTTAPGVTHQNDKTLWIDTTSGKNTPKRWVSNAWTAVTDKVATDAASEAATAKANAATAQTAANNAASAAAAAQGSANAADAKAVSALGAAATADTKAVNAASAAATAQTKAEAADAAALSAAGIANSKGVILYQTAAPATEYRNDKTLWIDTTGNANTPKRWNGTIWTAVTDKVATDAASTAATAKADAATAASAAATAQSAANAAASAAATADQKAANALGAAATAQSAAAAAQTKADSADAAAAAAAGIAGSKAVVLYQTATPAASYQNDKTLWIDTTSGKNTPKRWVSGAWAAVTDKVATDAASEAATAKANAATAQTAANNAASAAATAQGAANAADAKAASALGAAATADSKAVNAAAAASAAQSKADAADAAALAAAGIANSKGVILYQTATPTATYQNDKTLWIDTTSNANTPKRWNGNAWAAVTDKVATDAASVAATAKSDAAAAASAASTAQTAANNAASAASAAQGAASAADAKAVNALSAAATADTKAVNAAAAAATAQTKANAADAAAASAAGIAGSKATVLYQTGAPAAALQNDKTLWIDTTGNANTPKRWSGSAWVAVTDKVATDAASVAATAKSDAATAQAAAVAAQSAANTASGKADAAQSTANSASSTASAAAAAAATADQKAASAAGIANSKAVVLYQTAAPAAEFRNDKTLWIDTTGGANTPKRWTTGTTWVAVTDKTATDAATAAANANTAAGAAQTAANAAQSTASGAASAAQAAQNTADSAQSAAALAQTKADSAQTDASAAAAAAANAQTKANAADAAAAAAAGIAEGKGVVLYQTTAPGAEFRKSTTLWIDTTGGANTPKRWTTGTTWVAVTDKAATDAAAEAATAKANAATAQSAANSAASAASAAQTTANNAASAASAAQTTANGKNKVTYSTAIPGTTAGSAGDIWFRTAAGGVIIAQYENTGGTNWAVRTLDNAVIANLDAGKLTAGTISADRIGATAITAAKLAANAVTADKIEAGAVTAVKILAGAVTTDKIDANAVTAVKILAGAITTDKLDANAVTAVKINAGAVTADKIEANAVTAVKILAGAVTTDKMTANSINGDRITANTLHADKIVANTITAGKIATDAITADKILAGAVETNKIKAGALDAFLIVGGNIQTNAAPNRGVNINAAGLTAYDTSGNVTVAINSSGAASFKGDLETGSGNAIFKATTQGIQLGSGNFASAPFSVTAAGAMKATNASITGTINATGGAITGNLTLSGELAATYSDSLGNGRTALNGNGLITTYTTSGLYASTAQLAGGGLVFTGHQMDAQNLWNSHKITPEGAGLMIETVRGYGPPTTYTQSRFHDPANGVADGLFTGGISAREVSIRDGQWVPINLASGIYAFPSDIPRARKSILTGEIEVRGKIRGTGNAGYSIGTLPVGLRPTDTTQIWSTLGFYVQVTEDGNVASTQNGIREQVFHGFLCPTVW